jgi:DNA recombination protein RmuC
VAYGWRQNALAENALRIQELGEEMYKRLATFTAHLGKVGRTLGQSVEAYNSAVGSLERQVLPGARKFTELGLRPAREIEEVAPIDKLARTPADSEGTVAAPGTDATEPSPPPSTLAEVREEAGNPP